MIVAGDELAVDGVDAVRRRDSEPLRGGAVRGHAAEDVNGAVALEHRVVRARAHPFARIVREEEELMRIPDRCRSEQHRIHEAENCGVRSDTKRGGDDRGRCEAWRLRHRTQRIPRVLSNLVNDAQPARLPALFFDALGASEFDARAPFGLGARYARVDEIVGVGVEVKAEVFRHPLFEGAAMEQPCHERAQPLQQFTPRPESCRGPRRWPRPDASNPGLPRESAVARLWSRCSTWPSAGSRSRPTPR